jgi:MoaA/NifB/PqqE/SkfB family radical SAM enzyme
MSFLLTNHCNLNCSSCLTFSPLADPFFLSLEEFDRDVFCLSRLTHQLLRSLTLVGGEPLLHPQFLDFVKLARKYFPNTIIKSITNGILLAKQDNDFWKILQDNKVEVSVSDYPIDIDIALIKEKAERYNINMNIMIEHKDKYRQLHLVLDLEGRCDPQESFLQCFDWPSKCSLIKNGKIYLCVICANIDIFNKYFNKNLEVTSEDYIDIHEVKSINEVLQFLAGPKPFCRYCNTNKTGGLHKWKAGKKEIIEWT